MSRRVYRLSSRDIFHMLNSMFDRSFALEIQTDIARFARSSHNFYLSDVSPAEVLMDFCSFRYNFLKKEDFCYV